MFISKKGSLGTISPSPWGRYQPICKRSNDPKGIKYKQALITALVLALPSLEQPFQLFVNVNKGIALGVLTQKHGGQC
jgi:hypothetical protein